METKEKENSTVKNNQAVKGANPVTEENKNPKFVAGNTVNKDSVKPDVNKPKEETGVTQTEAPKAGQAKQENAQPQTEQPKAEPTKPGLKEEVRAEKPVPNLEETVKLVSGLGKKIAQRDKVKNTIANLDSFSIAQTDDDEVTDGNKFQRCELVITDDKENEFVTKNPYIIDHVAQYVNSLCVEKLAEIEASIILPL